MRDLNDQPEQLDLPREGGVNVALSGRAVLTLEEAAQLLRVHPETVRRHAIVLGGIKVGRVWRFARERLQSGRALRSRHRRQTMAIRKRGNTWWIHFTTPSGQRVRQSAQTADKRAAQELHDKLRSESWRAGRLGEIPGRWFEEAATRWLKEARHKASIQHDAAKVRFFRRHFAGNRLDEITRDAVDRLVSPMTPATANRHVAWIRAMLRKAEREWGWLDRAPAFKTYREPRRRIRWLTQEEFGRLHAAAPRATKTRRSSQCSPGCARGTCSGSSGRRSTSIARSLGFIPIKRKPAGRSVCRSTTRQLHSWRVNRAAISACLAASHRSPAGCGRAP